MNGSSSSTLAAGGEADGGDVTPESGVGITDDSSDYSLELPHYIRINATFFCGLVFFVGVFGNLLIPLVIWRNKDMRNSTNLFLVNLSVADLFVLLVCMPTVIVEIHSAKPESWILGEGMCKAVPFLELTMAHGSVLTILAISFERYYAICKPLTASYKLTQFRGCIIIILIWLLACLATSPILAIAEYTWRDYLDTSVVPVCLMEVRSMWHKLYFTAVITVLFFLPLVVLVIIYAIITRHLIVAPACMVGTRLGDTSNMRARRQVVTMLAAVVVFFFVCLMPFRVFTLWIIFSSEEQIESVGVETYYNVLFFCRTMFYINSAINPILYNVMSSKFREAFVRVLRCNERDAKRKRLDRQTTFNTTYTSLTSSLKGGRAAVSSPDHIHAIATTVVSVRAMPTKGHVNSQDSAV
uniref:G-protein coupled receptors family 1 profile domain-containing protein n=1 Tax=Strigamia maritima TaxID=126957 RepID=T1IW50_STRMM